MGGDGVAQPFPPYIRYTIAIGVGAAQARVIGKVDAEAVRRAQAWPLGDPVAHGDATLLDQGDGRYRPTFLTEFCSDGVEESYGVMMNGQGRKAVGDDKGYIEGRRAVGEQILQIQQGVFVKLPPQIGALQIQGTIAGRAAQSDGPITVGRKLLFDRFDV
jgi:hypothetical protein